MRTRLRGGNVIDPVHNVDAIADIWIEDGRIIERPDDRKADEEIDVSGHIVMAGAIDVHSHIAGGGVNGQAGAHSWQANLRHDRNSQFGGSSTGATLGSSNSLTGTAGSALFNLADVVPARRLFAWSAVVAALANAAMDRGSTPLTTSEA